MFIFKKLFSAFNTGLIFILLSAGFIINTCEENSTDFSIGGEFVESQTKLSLIDTFSVTLATAILDSVITSGTGKILVGGYSDTIFGKVQCQSYFQIGPSVYFDVYEDDIYDSLRLELTYNGYFYGDTTKEQNITVYQLNENIQLNDDDQISGMTSFNYNPDPIGSINYLPTPNKTGGIISIAISDDIGYDLFLKLKDVSDILTDSTRFIDYFHGLALASDGAYQDAVIGFNATADDARLVLYTTRVGESRQKIAYEFSLQNTTRQFNHIVHDFTLTRLSGLEEQRKMLPAGMTNDLSYLQGGTGLLIRVDFPSLKDILLLERGTITKAHLCLSPSRDSYHEFELPDYLIAYKADQYNKVLADEGAIAGSSLTIDELYNEETVYSFDLTYYIKNEIADSYVDSEYGLLITLPSSGLMSTFNRVIIDSRELKPMLKIYYLTY
ncbi:MAG: DUF4270 family protein [Calditrichaceae bacterium]|nr:DUF4270 family protein [Calditrichaceae bacterium]MBN2709679.1 DUF4270 family protein [Calditrichaceae bacterium]RQV95037.1 MAG: DUF4270 family protein [Calditrichota bacterium]